MTNQYGVDVTDQPRHQANLNPIRYRGYHYDAELNMYWLTTRFYDPEIGRFANADQYAYTGQGICSCNMYLYCENEPVNRYDVEGLFWKSLKNLISNIIHLANDLARAVGIDTAAVGAFFLEMYKDENGVYHAEFDCWQQYAGYNDLYDLAFDVGTSMVAAKFSFSYENQGYTIWAWKGDYINLGAGAELGIYLGNSGHRIVDKSLAMEMAMIITYKTSVVAEFFPESKQWWITSFNPNYQNVNANDLFVTFGVWFSNPGMYSAFKKQWGADQRWSFYDDSRLAIFQF